MRVNTYVLLRECIERGIRYGLGRCAKYEIDRESEAFAERISNEVMSAIGDYFNWDDEVSS